MQPGQKSSREKQAAFCEKYRVSRQTRGRFRMLARTRVGVGLIYLVLRERSSPGDPEGKEALLPTAAFLQAFALRVSLPDLVAAEPPGSPRHFFSHSRKF